MKEMIIWNYASVKVNHFYIHPDIKLGTEDLPKSSLPIPKRWPKVRRAPSVPLCATRIGPGSRWRSRTRSSAERSTSPGGNLALANRLKNALVFKEDELPGTFVRMQSTATLKDLSTGESFVYRLVFPADADIAYGRISILSPLGVAMLGRKVGEEFRYQSPGGTVRIRVEDNSHEPT